MNRLSITVVLGLLALGCAQLGVRQPECDSPEAEEAAYAAQDYLNGQHAHGYKYALNRIEDIKILTKANADDIYVVEVDLLETDCHVLDPTPVANCTVRPKALTSVEGDCDVVMKRVGGVLTVTAFKCKTEESTEDLCLGCPTLLPLNDTTALNFVHASLATFNNNTVNTTYSLLEVGRMSTQIVSGGPRYLAEYVIVEANCTDDVCVPRNDVMASRGICTAKDLGVAHTVDCKMFSVTVPPQDANSTVGSHVFPSVHVYTQNMTRKHALRHHKLTALHDPHATGLLSSESASESAEVVSVATPAVFNATAPAPTADTSSASVSGEVPVAVVKRDVPDAPATVTDPVLLIAPCPGRVRFF